VVVRQQRTSRRMGTSRATPVDAHVVPSRQKSSGLGVLEQFGVELVALEKLVELRAVALREPRRLGHVAIRDATDLSEVVAPELAARVLEGRELGLLVLYRLLGEGHRDERRGGER